jgi:hypothetical protein
MEKERDEITALRKLLYNRLNYIAASLESTLLLVVSYTLLFFTYLSVTEHMYYLSFVLVLFVLCSLRLTYYSYKRFITLFIDEFKQKPPK